MLNKLLKSVLDQDTAPVVVCDIDDIIVYMNPSAVERYHKDLTGKSIKDCHPPKANEMIDKVVAWFRESKDNNIIYTYRNDEENKDVYMVAPFKLLSAKSVKPPINSLPMLIRMPTPPQTKSPFLM